MIIIPTLQVWKLRDREVKQLAQSHTTHQWRRPDLGTLVLASRFLPTKLYCLLSPAVKILSSGK